MYIIALIAMMTMPGATGDIRSDKTTTNADSIKQKAIDAPVAGDDGEFMMYDHGTGTIQFNAPSGAGDITGVTAGNGLHGGGESGDVTLDLDTAKVRAIADTTVNDTLWAHLDDSTAVLWTAINDSTWYALGAAGDTLWAHLDDSTGVLWAAITDSTWMALGAISDTLWAHLDDSTGVLWTALTDSTWMALGAISDSLWAHLDDSTGVLWVAISDSTWMVLGAINDTTQAHWNTWVQTDAEINTLIDERSKDADSLRGKYINSDPVAGSDGFVLKYFNTGDSLGWAADATGAGDTVSSSYLVHKNLQVGLLSDSAGRIIIYSADDSDSLVIDVANGIVTTAANQVIVIDTIYALEYFRGTQASGEPAESVLVTIETIEDSLGLRLLLTGGTMSGNIDMGDEDIFNIERMDCDTVVISGDEISDFQGAGLGITSNVLHVDWTWIWEFIDSTTSKIPTTLLADNVADADYGDVTVSSGAWAVEDDSHDHTGATLTLRLDQVSNSNTDKTFTMTNDLKFTFTGAGCGYDGGFEMNLTGAYSGDVQHIHQHTGNPSYAVLLNLENEDADVINLISTVHADADTNAAFDGGVVFIDRAEIDTAVIGLPYKGAVNADSLMLTIETLEDSLGQFHDLITDLQTEPRYLASIINPNALFVADSILVLVDPRTEAAITITRIEVTCLADPDTELDFDLMFCDAYIGNANRTVIDEMNTTNGAISITAGFDDATIPVNKCVYIRFNAEPDAGIVNVGIRATYTID